MNYEVCDKPGLGWTCSRALGHEGACSAVPDAPRLADLNPDYWADGDGKGYLSLDCPVCGPRHRLCQLPVWTGDGPAPAFQTGVNRWTMTGAPPDWDSVSLLPSVDWNPGGSSHWHGYITDGKVTTV